MRYYKKYIVQTKVYGPDGKPVPFEILANNTGCLAIDEATETGAKTVAFLDGLIEKHIGGVEKMSKEEYAELKKKIESAKQPAKAEAAEAEPQADGNADEAKAAKIPATTLLARAIESSKPAGARTCPRCGGEGRCKQCGGKRTCFKCKGRGWLA